jgi:hypothetical protein
MGHVSIFAKISKNCFISKYVCLFCRFVSSNLINGQCGRLGVFVARLFSLIAGQRGVFAPFARALAGRVCAAVVLGDAVLKSYLDHNESLFGGDASGERAETIAALRKAHAAGALRKLSPIAIIDAFRTACVVCYWFDVDVDGDIVTPVRKTEVLADDSLHDVVVQGAHIEFEVALVKALQASAAAQNAATGAGVGETAKEAARTPAQTGRKSISVVPPKFVVKQNLFVSRKHALALLAQPNNDEMETLATKLAGVRAEQYGRAIGSVVDVLLQGEEFQLVLTAAKNKNHRAEDDDSDDDGDVGWV